MEEKKNSFPSLDELASRCYANDKIDVQLYTENDVKRGLRDQNGKGVVVGLKISQRSTLKRLSMASGFRVAASYAIVGSTLKNWSADSFLRADSALKKLHIYYFLVICLQKKSWLTLKRFWLVAEHFRPTLFVMLS